MKCTSLLSLRPVFLALLLAVAGLGRIGVAAEQTPTSAPSKLFARDFKIDHRYLNIPIKHGATKQKVALLVDGTPIVVNEMELAPSAPDWWAFIDMKAWQGRTATLQVIGPDARSELLEPIELGDSFKGSEDVYKESLRPQIHFSSRRGWINDPNGLVYFNGEYHRFYQHNPYGWDWGNMHWGHATSRDLVHWEEQGDVLMPDSLGAMFSGSAVVDWQNTSGFGHDGRPPLVLIYTAAGSPFTQCIAYSTDGRNFTKYANNPVIGSVTPLNRDPKVFWYAPSKHWVLVLYTEAPVGTGMHDAKGEQAMVGSVQFLTSPNLRDWTPVSTIAGDTTTGRKNEVDRFLFECPDLFELPVEGDAKARKWVISGASGAYAVGTFDGQRFVPETTKLRGNFGTGSSESESFSTFYAAQTFSDAPDGRRIQIGWGLAESPGMSFNMLHLLPCELSLRQTSDGPRLVRTPVRELLSLRDGPDQGQALEKFSGDAIEFRAEIDAGKTGRFEVDIRGAKISYDATTQQLNVNGQSVLAPWVNGRQNIVVYVDRTVIEAFASDGLIYFAAPFIPEANNRSVSVHSGADSLKVGSLQVYKLKSIWDQK